MHQKYLMQPEVVESPDTALASKNSRRVPIFQPMLRHNLLETGHEVYLHGRDEQLAEHAEMRLAQYEQQGEIKREYKKIGCFSFEEDLLREGIPTDFMDPECMHAKDGSCHGGFPFFRKVIRDTEKTDEHFCPNFCLSMALDVAAHVKDIHGNEECRCGASTRLKELWTITGAKAFLAAPLSEVRECVGNASGQIRVFQYVGKLVDDGIPFQFLKLTEDELMYTDAILTGEIHFEIDGPVENMTEDYTRVNNSSSSKLARRELDSTKPEWRRRKCYPYQCEAGIPWPETSDETGKWERVANVPFVFSPGLDIYRKDAFRQAVQIFNDAACIYVHEVSTLPERPYIEVGVFDESTCWSEVGEVRRGQRINLGWCKDYQHLPSIVHELGHSIGMQHEQQRPDAWASYHGKGPFLHIHWENIKSNWRYWYQAYPNAYTGSKGESEDDPYKGYAKYDFSSIMHYTRQAPDQPWGVYAFDTIPAGVQVSGRTLSSGDISQLMDAYHCVPAVSHTSEIPQVSCIESAQFENQFLRGVGGPEDYERRGGGLVQARWGSCGECEQWTFHKLERGFYGIETGCSGYLMARDAPESFYGPGSGTVNLNAYPNRRFEQWKLIKNADDTVSFLNKEGGLLRLDGRRVNSNVEFGGTVNLQAYVSTSNIGAYERFKVSIDLS
eukprot:CAMPEP_0184481980 /NCGR_PEP_ID=MMETSP0113_2-20130426/3570_1 /TAXON_ID=91329 /ORGANISM="Norrisiella sphaerica, Strain BC52" /LENGTH=668 /DNA_ID=CAMNT_0026861479 /DNA_START=205 /DNA_END=2211 /DNA_ORIENTATION=-